MSRPPRSRIRGLYFRYNRSRQPLGWYFRYTDANGERQHLALGLDQQGAESRALLILSRVKDGEVGRPVRTEEMKAQAVITVKEMIESFVEKYSRPKIKSMAAYRIQARCALKTMVEPHSIARMAAAAVRRRDVEDWRDAVSAAGYSAYSVNRAWALLSRAYNWAADRELVAVRNPVSRVEKMPIKASEEHYSLAEVHALLLRPDCPAMVWAALYTGMRKGELFGLRWRDVHLGGEIPRIEVKTSYDTGSTKSQKPRTVPVHPELLPVLRGWQSACPKVDDLVFPTNEPQTRGRRVSGWRMGSAADMAGLPDLLRGTEGCHVPQERTAMEGREARDRCWLAMRHTFATQFLEASGNGDALSKLLGHSLGGGGGAAVTAGYTHTSLAYLHRELVKMTLRPPLPADVLDLQRRKRSAK